MRARLDDAHHRQADLAVAAAVGVVTVVTGIDAEHVDAAHRVAVDRGLVEPGQRTFGDDLLGAHQSLRLGDGHPHRPGRHRGGSHPGLLLLHRTH